MTRKRCVSTAMAPLAAPALWGILEMELLAKTWMSVRSGSTPCRGMSMCNNTDGSFSCFCEEGFALFSVFGEY